MRAHDHHCAAPIGHKTAVVTVQRLDLHGRRQVVVHRDRLAQLRIRVGGSVPPRGDGNCAERFGRGRVLDDVPLMDHGVPRRSGKPPVRGLCAAGPTEEVGRAAARVVSIGHQSHFALPGFDGHDGESDQGDVGSAALVPRAPPPGLHAHCVRNFLTVERFSCGGRRLQKKRVNLFFANAGICKCFPARHRIQ